MHVVANMSHFFGLLTVEILPPDENVKELKESDVWIYVFVIPVTFALITNLLLTFFLKHDRPAFYISNDQENEAIEVISLVYDTTVHSAKQIYDYLVERTNK